MQVQRTCAAHVRVAMRPVRQACASELCFALEGLGSKAR